GAWPLGGAAASSRASPTTVGTASASIGSVLVQVVPAASSTQLQPASTRGPVVRVQLRTPSRSRLHAQPVLFSAPWPHTPTSVASGTSLPAPEASTPERPF